MCTSGAVIVYNEVSVQASALGVVVGIVDGSKGVLYLFFFFKFI